MPRKFLGARIEDTGSTSPRLTATMALTASDSRNNITAHGTRPAGVDAGQLFSAVQALVKR